MRVLFVGMSEKAGSAIMRGKQMADQREEWDYKFNPSYEDMLGYDAIVLIKKAKPRILHDIKKAGAIFFYDALDWWGQESFNEEEAKARLRSHLNRVDADCVIATHLAYGVDMIGLCRDWTTIEHHYDPRLDPSVGGKRLVYYGESRYIVYWWKDLVSACTEVGWEFLMNPSNLTRTGAMVSLRDSEYNSWINKNWKSSVKLATAEGIGVPLIYKDQESVNQFKTEHTYTFDDIDELPSLIAKLKPVEINTRFSVENMAYRYEEMFNRYS